MKPTFKKFSAIKLVLILTFLFAFSDLMKAQPRALGLRGGYGAELSYQHSLGRNFVEADLGWGFNGLWVSGIYDFLFPIQDGFNFYAGPGAQLGMFMYHKDGRSLGRFDLGLVGQIGVEYNFDFPLQLSLDWRPSFTFLGGGFGYYGIALGARYRF